MVDVAPILARLRAAGVSPVGITADSRKLGAGEVFAAWPGFRTDGRRYIGSAVERGAAAVLWESADGFNPGAARAFARSGRSARLRRSFGA